MTTRREVTVVGAGLAGLTTAWYLTDAGASVHVIEAADRPGGLIQTINEPHGLVETAARAFTGSPRIDALFAATGVTPIAPRKSSRRRYIYRDGRPRRWPLSAVETLSSGARFGVTWLRRGVAPRSDESVAQWGRRVVGAAATSALLGPVLQGIYASPPEELAAAAIFGSKRPKRGALVAPAGGMGELMRRLHAELERRGATFTFGAPATAIDAGRLTAICTSAPMAAQLLAPVAPQLAAAIARIRMVRLQTITMFYPVHAGDVHGFGVLFPRRAGIDALGVLFNADIFDGRSDVRSETWIYAASPAGAPWMDAEICARASADRAAFTRRHQDPLSWFVPPPALLPIYGPDVLAATRGTQELPSGIALAGNYLGRLGVSAIVDDAAEAAARLMRRDER